LCTFNDDIQGTATVALAAVLSALRSTGRELTDQRVAIVGAGSAGSGIAEQLVAAMVAHGLAEAEARSRFFLVDREGLLFDDQDGLEPFQVPLARPRSAVAGWALADPTKASLVEVIEGARPSILIGVTGVFGLFSEEVVRAMAAADDRPIIFPLSNPTNHAEATAEDVLTWTDGRAIVATGSPFAPVTLGGTTFTIAQSNNSYIFPGVGLGVRASRASRVTDAMFMAAAHALADHAEAEAAGDPILPPLVEVRAVGRAIAIAVAKAAVADGVAPAADDDHLVAAVDETMWFPDYASYVPADPPPRP
jgi:malate dehydrogenase (oxaloacetate-decarboxylating)